MEFLPYISKWIEILLRWSHVMFAILWVGNSFLFNYLDNKLEKNTISKEVNAQGILQHSGWFYRLERLNLPPEKFSKNLIIFKWQSYLTFITGILLLAVIYYYRPEILMVDKKVLNMLPSTAIILSILSLVVSWLIYDFLCKSNLIKNDVLFISIIFILLMLLSYGFTQMYGAKFAFLSVGLVIGTNMFGNVFTVIIPNQMNIINSSKRNKKFDLSLSLSAKQRSIHNNYSTFLVLFIMLSGHYSFIVYHKYNWLILSAIAVISALARHYFNLRGRNIHRLYILITSIVSLILLAVLLLIFKN